MSTTVAAWTSRSRPGKQLFRSALGAAAFALASTVLATPGGPVRSSPHLVEHEKVPVQVVVVTLDGARFQEIFWGVDAAQARQSGTPMRVRENARELLPNLHRLMTEQGAALGAGRGPHISASGPDFVSLPGYAEIFTGRRATGCLDNGCPGASFESIADQVAAQWGAKSAIITSWPDIARVGSRSKRVAISTGRHAGATRSGFDRPGALGEALRAAETEKPWPGGGDFRRDRFTASLALAYLRAERPNFLFVGLGETDEFAHQGNYAGYLDALREADRFLGELSAELEARAKAGVRTALFVTADHGRAASFKEHGKPYPESARVWLVASGTAITARGFVTSPQQRHLADIAPTVRSVFGLPADGSRGAGSPLTELLPEAR
ncbi:MAG TPA: alkaline phosphatase family protein [Polyangiaceae bacterium]|nr:alkaline phosphatase family protein [Polyangiaceae bacterium]